MVHFRGYLPHKASVRCLLKANLLWLFIAESEGETVLTGKLFEYLGAGKKIIGSVPRGGAAASVIRSLDAGVVVAPGDVDGLKNAIAASYGKWMRGEKDTVPREKVKLYDRRLLSGQLAEILDEVLLTPGQEGL
jgi:glycosyltransferase involved in cell wall biosynthesis